MSVLSLSATVWLQERHTGEAVEKEKGFAYANS
jgi:hypothetical protein